MAMTATATKSLRKKVLTLEPRDDEIHDPLPLALPGVLYANYIIEPRRGVNTFYRCTGDLYGLYPVHDCFIKVLAYEYLPAAGEPRTPRGQAQRLPHGRVLHPHIRAHVAPYNLHGVE